MDWEQKLSALQAIADTSLRMRKPGDWYVNAPGRSIGGDGFLTGSYGNGKTPEDAVEDDWRKMTTIPEAKFIVVENYKGRRHLRWNGFMWDEIPQEQPQPEAPQGES